MLPFQNFLVTLRSRIVAMFCNENTPLRKLSSESAINTCSSLKLVLFIFALIGRVVLNPLTPNDHYSGRTAPLTSNCCILYIYSTNIGTEYF